MPTAGSASRVHRRANTSASIRDGSIKSSSASASLVFMYRLLGIFDQLEDVPALFLDESLDLRVDVRSRAALVPRRAHDQVEARRRLLNLVLMILVPEKVSRFQVGDRSVVDDLRSERLVTDIFDVGDDLARLIDVRNA